MNSKQRRQVERRGSFPTIRRAIEGGYYDGASDLVAFEERTRALLGQPWTFPRGYAAKRIRAALVERRRAS